MGQVKLRNGSKSKSVIPKSLKCFCQDTRTEAIHAEMRRLDVAKHPNASAVLLRLLLEFSVSLYLDTTGHIKPLLDKAKADKKPSDWYPRIWVKLRREGWRVNRKRVYRLYKHEVLCVGRHKPRRHRSAVTRVNESWSMDFMSDQLFDGRKFRLLTLVDDFSRESPVIELDGRLSGERVVESLDRLGRQRGLPEKIRVDNGSEFTGKLLDQWAYVNKVWLDFSRPGKPTDNGLIEAFNGRLRAECINENWFMSIDDARQKVEAWRRHYNEERPHSALGNLSPREFTASKARECTAG